MEGWRLFAYSLTTLYLGIVIDRVLEGKKLPKFINPETVQKRGEEMLIKMIGAAILIEGKEMEKEFPITIEGLGLNNYLFKIIMKDAEIRKLYDQKELSGLLKYLFSTLQNLSDSKTPTEDIEILKKIIEYLDKFFREDRHLGVMAAGL